METDVLIIGCGPAGVQAAIHASRGKLSVTVAGKPSASAIAGTDVENYFGTGSVSGSVILSEGIGQAKAFGASFLDQNVVSCSREGDLFSFVIEDGTEIASRSVIFATGISRRKLGVPGEKELFGKGVSYCAVCDCNFYKGRSVLIVGNDSEAAVSAELMTRYASETFWAAWDVEADPKLVAKAKDAGAKLLTSKPKEIRGEEKVQSVLMDDGAVVEVDGVFIELGAKSAADLAMDLDIMPEIDDTIKVNPDCSTEVPGAFACGDITGRPWQVAKAVGQGCIAGMAAVDYVRGKK